MLDPCLLFIGICRKSWSKLGATGQRRHLVKSRMWAPALRTLNTLNDHIAAFKKEYDALMQTQMDSMKVEHEPTVSTP